MDGNKEITGSILICVLAIVIVACKVQAPPYAKLYIDNMQPIADSVKTQEVPIKISNITGYINQNLRDSFGWAEKWTETYFDSTHINDITMSQSGDNDSMQLGGQYLYKHQLDSVVNKNIEYLERYNAGNFDSLKVATGIGFMHPFKKDTMEQVLLQVDNNTKMDSIRSYYSLSDSIQIIKRFNERQQISDTAIQMYPNTKPLCETRNFNADTTFVINEMGKQRSGNKTIDSLNQQVFGRQYQLEPDRKNDIESSKLVIGETNTDYNSMRQSMQSKDKQIQLLQKQLNTMQYATDSRQQYYPEVDTIKRIRNDVQKTYDATKSSLDTNLFFADAEVRESVTPTDKTVFLLLSALQDTIHSVRNQVVSLKKQIALNEKKANYSETNEKDEPKESKTYSISLVAYFKPGKIHPINEANVLHQLEEFCTNKKVSRITLSGYTDRSGNAKLNEEITALRLNYISEKIALQITKERIFYQNFGDTLASNTIIDDERRIEIVIYTQ